jgi:YVTN family beta-propeller protein
MERALVFVPVNLQSSHPKRCAVYVFDAETGHHRPELTIEIPELGGSFPAVDMKVTALAVGPGGASVILVAWSSLPQGEACFPYVIDMQEHHPSAANLGGFPLESGGSPPEVTGGMAVGPDAGQTFLAFNSLYTMNRFNFAGATGVGNGPYGVAVSPDGTRVYVTNAADGTVSVLNPTVSPTRSPGLVGLVPVGHNPQGVAVTPDSAHAYVANSADGTVSVIDASSLATNTFAVAANPQGVAVAPDGKHVYVAHGAPTNALRVIDPASPGTGQVSIPTFDGTCAVAVTPDSRHVWVLCAPTSASTPARLVQIATEGPHMNEVIKTIDVSALAPLVVPQFVGVFVSAPINREEIGVLSDIEVQSPVVRGNSTTARVFIEHALSRPTYVWPGFAGSSPDAVLPPRITIPAGAKHADFDVYVSPLQPPGEIRVAAAAVFVKSKGLLVKA